MKKHFRILSLLSAAVLLFSCAGGAAIAADDSGRETVSISTAMDFMELAENCRLDVWSENKLVTLENDIDLSGVAFEPIAVFCGEFLGNGHTIRGLDIRSDTSAVGGLFRYVHEGAVIRDLNVSGSVHPGANADSFGGIVGENRGNLINCSFAGTIEGRSAIGGIAGVNTASGKIYGCSSNGKVSAEHSNGGIAGENMGSIIRCSNSADVNTTDTEISMEDISIDFEHLNSAENVAAHTDCGGIAGYSTGIIQSCVNNGSVGYPHVGYNIGGIAGRQSGFLDGCTNSGTIHGRKDVGGIVGQMVPSIEMEYSETVLDELKAELDTLEKLIDSSMANFEGASGAISARLSSAGVYLDSARDSIMDMSEDLTDFVNGNVGSVNSFSATIVRYVERLAPILSNLRDFSTYMSAAGAELEKAIDEMEDGSEEAQKTLDELKAGAGYISDAMTAAGEAISALETLINELNQALENNASFSELMTILGNHSGDIADAMDHLDTAVDALDKAMEHMEKAMEEAEKLMAELDDALPHIKQAMTYMESAMNKLALALDSFAKWVEDLGKEKPMELVGINAGFNQSAERLDASLAGLSIEFEGLNNAVNSAVGQLSGDLRAVNEQFFRVMDLFIEFVEDSGRNDGENIVEDVSEKNMFESTEGKVSASVNHGEVNGDVNTGGVAGIVAVEYDLDPEEDISVSGEGSMNFRYLAQAILIDCENRGEVNGKNDCTGGVAGKTDIGIVYGCSGFGTVRSSSGDYVGGVAGQAGSTLRENYAMCRLSGQDYVGGIAGEGKDIYDCRSIVEIESARGWRGAIAGAVSGETAGNLFVSDTLGGVDGISYAGKAQPVSYGKFISEEGIPEEFSGFTLTFVADGETVLSMPFTYGMSISQEALPAVPVKEGHTGRWDKQSWEKLTFSETVEALYTPFATTIASQEVRGEKCVILAQGAFLPNAELSIAKTESSEAAFAQFEDAKESMLVKVSGSVGESLSLRYLLPEDIKEAEIWILGENGWNRAEASTEGSYMIFAAAGESTVFCCVDTGSEPIYIIIAAAAAAAVLAALTAFLVVRRKKKKGAHERQKS